MAWSCSSLIPQASRLFISLNPTLILGPHMRDRSQGVHRGLAPLMLQLFHRRSL
jgi:hypothetical protein